ncbi:MAG: NAD(P)H-binding protein, partial [Myxococcota bacterium]
MTSEHRTARGAAGLVLVTGANGQLGRRLIERFARDGVATRAVVRSDAAAAALAKLPLEVAPEIVVLNYSDTAQLIEAARGCEYAVHLVGILKEDTRSRYSEAHQASSRSLAVAADAARMRRTVYLSILGTDPKSDNP